MAIGEHFGFFTTCASISYTDLHRPENVQTLEKFNLLNNTEKFNYLFKNNCWVQDVQTRVFSTLGQPNWLAALLVALLPISLIYSLKNKFYMLVSIIFFTTLIFTKSRSGFLAFGVEFLILWGYLFWKEKMKYIKEFIFITLSFSLLTFFFLTKSNNSTITMPNSGGPALETGGTESGSIRKYVWIGALNIFLKNPLLGTGPETFAFSFPTQKPTEHNLTSEWDFIYNKAHNEFLNILSNTGIVGFTAYILIVISTISILILKNKNADPNYYNIALLSSFVSILVTNFFGFSVVIISLLFYLIPAISVTLDVDKIHRNNTRQSLKEKLYLLTITIITITILTKIFNYWRSDIYYNSSKKKQDINQINKAISLTPKEPIFLAHRSLLTGSTEDSFNAYKMSLYNQNIRRIYISNLVKNTSANQSNLYRAEEILLEGIKISPNDPRLYYQIGILQLKFGKNVEGIKNLQKAVELKPNYKEVRFALGSLFKEINENDLARQEFEYILNNIDPYDELTKNQLEELK